MQTAIITGGSGTIGSALVAEFARDHRVIFTYCSNREKALQIADKYGAEAVKCDQTRADDIKNLCSMLTSCDLLINNAGISKIGLFTDVSDDELNNVINTNLNGAMCVSKSVLSFMIAAKKGCIINISSIWGLHGASCEVAYSASKAGMIGFTKALAKEVGPCGIRVNCIAPGLIDSVMNSHLSKEELDEFADSTCLCRTGKPEDVANAARYLSEAEFVTGQVLAVDGGIFG